VLVLGFGYQVSDLRFRIISRKGAKHVLSKAEGSAKTEEEKVDSEV